MAWGGHVTDEVRGQGDWGRRDGDGGRECKDSLQTDNGTLTSGAKQLLYRFQARGNRAEVAQDNDKHEQPYQHWTDIREIQNRSDNKDKDGKKVVDISI